MKERPILFSSPMVRALLAGSKTQTRRVVKITHKNPGLAACLTPPIGEPRPGTVAELCPHGQPGDRIWVRENFRTLDTFDSDSPRGVGDLCIAAGYSKPWAPMQYEADGAQVNWQSVGTRHQKPSAGKLRPSLHMPRWASRILLEIVSVRVERLNDCSAADATAEGVAPDQVRQISVFGANDVERAAIYRLAAIRPYERLWESINGAGSWAANPWVWVIEFKRVPQHSHA